MITASRSRTRYTAILAIALGVDVLCPELAGAGAASVDCSISYETPDGFFVDAGSNRGLRRGDRGTVLRGGEQIASVEILETSGKWALLRVVSTHGPTNPAVGDRVSFAVDRNGSEGTNAETGEPSSSLKEHPGGEESFVPFLAAPTRPQRVRGDPSNIFHGDLFVRQLFQFDPETDQDFSITRVGSSGSIERVGGTPWALEWAGDVSYRDGEGLEDTRDYRKFRLHVFRAALYRRFGDGSNVRMGRFLPRVLPGVGYLDGLQGEMVVNDSLRLGAMVGFRPERRRLDLSFREPTAVPYVVLELGERDDLYYYGTAGVLGSLYEGSADRLAVLLDQRADIGGRFSVRSTSAVDFDVNAESRSGTRLTRLDLFADYVVAPSLTLRAGVDHYERPDTEAERDTLTFENDKFFDRGYWRYWVGARHTLPWSLLVSEEVAFTESPTAHYEPRWRVSLTRIGLPGLPDGSLTLNAYNFQGSETDGLDTAGYGGSVSASIPLLDHRLSLQPVVTLRYLETDLDSESFWLVDFTGRCSWLISSSWSLNAGVSYSFGVDVSRFLVDVGVTFRW